MECRLSDRTRLIHLVGVFGLARNNVRRLSYKSTRYSLARTEIAFAHYHLFTHCVLVFPTFFSLIHRLSFTLLLLIAVLLIFRPKPLWPDFY